MRWRWCTDVPFVGPAANPNADRIGSRRKTLVTKTSELRRENRLGETLLAGQLTGPGGDLVRSESRLAESPLNLGSRRQTTTSRCRAHPRRNVRTWSATARATRSGSTPFGPIVVFPPKRGSKPFCRASKKGGDNRRRNIPRLRADPLRLRAASEANHDLGCLDVFEFLVARE